MAYSCFNFDKESADRRLQEAERRLDAAQKHLEQEGDRLAREGERLMREGERMLDSQLGKMYSQVLESQLGTFNIRIAETTRRAAGAATKTVTETHSTAGVSRSSTRSEGMSHFLIAYEPKTANFGRYDALSKALQKCEAWWNFVDHVWIVATSESADILWQRVAGAFGKNDNVIVLELSSGPDRQGWLPEDAWNWFSRNMPRGKTKPAAPTKLGIPYNAFQGGSTLVMPDGIKVRVVRGADGVYFVNSESDKPISAAPVSAGKKPQEQPELPKAPASIGALKCDFCGNETPANEWINNDCPRCGITRGA